MWFVSHVVWIVSLPGSWYWLQPQLDRKPINSIVKSTFQISYSHGKMPQTLHNPLIVVKTSNTLLICHFDFILHDTLCLCCHRPQAQFTVVIVLVICCIVFHIFTTKMNKTKEPDDSERSSTLSTWAKQIQRISDSAFTDHGVTCGNSGGSHTGLINTMWETFNTSLYCEWHTF